MLELFEKTPAPVKSASIVWLPALRLDVDMLAHASGVGLQGPMLIAGPEATPSILNCTDPVGAVEPDAGAICAVKVSPWPKTDGLADDVTVVVVATLLDVLESVKVFWAWKPEVWPTAVR